MDRKRSASRIELLAPAGDLKRAQTAVLYGADAVYLGGMKFSLRSRASNFTMDDIREACEFAHAHGSKVHVTVNMIPHDEDFEGLSDYLKELEEIGVDAFITASPAIMKLIRECTSRVEIHCSTQMSVTNAAAANWLKETLDIDRVVLARECSMNDVKSITRDCLIDTEAFIHGGMCVNISGRCTLSNRMTLRDANRGGCAQSCRWTYQLLDGQRCVNERELFTMGSKDLFAADEICDLIEAGVSSLKIEGRMKTEYYVASIVSGYRHLIDEIYENGGRLPEERMAYHRAQIMKGENREVCEGFYPGIAGAGTIIRNTTSDANVNHGFLATVVSFDEARMEAVIETRNPFDTGDEMEILSPGMDCRTFTLTAMKDLKDDSCLTASRRPMAQLLIQVPFAVRAGDIVRKAV